MKNILGNDVKRNVGFVSTRISGTDGVSLEITKWADVFEKEDFTCYYFAGELDRPPERCYLLPEAHFNHPEIVFLHQNCFGVRLRSRLITQKIYEAVQLIKDHLYEFIEKFNLDLLVPQNALTIPMNLPLGIALTEVISETGIPTIAHHHDFFWERPKYLVNAVGEYLNMAFPPNLNTIKHVVINTSGDAQLSFRTGISSTIIPNVMDFANPPLPPDDYAKNLRRDMGVEDDELFVLQPTRVVKRKGIESAIELVHRLGRKAKLVISHSAGDEGLDYLERVHNYSKLLGVKTVLAADIVGDHRGTTKDGRKIYTLQDVYPYADLVTYPSIFEGFGNAFLEAIYFKKPIVVNTYSIYTTDIQPKGFSVIEIDGYVTDETVRQTVKILDDPKLRNKMVDHNYAIAKRSFSYAILQQRLKTLIVECLT